MTRFLHFFIALLLPLVAAQNSTEEWGGCVFPSDPSAPTQVKIGQPTPVCITVGPGGSWAAGVPYVRWVFTPKADQYSYFRIPDSFNDFVNGNQTLLQDRNLTVHTASQDILSFLRVYYDPVESRIFPFLTAIIDVDGGIVQGIAWDNACVFCSPDECLENTYNFDGDLAVGLEGQSKGCFLNKKECDAFEEEKSDTCTPSGKCTEKDCTCENECDIRVYVVWTGTDVDGNVFQSSSSRFSAFPAQRIQDRIQQLLPDIPDIDLPDNPFTRR